MRAGLGKTWLGYGFKLHAILYGIYFLQLSVHFMTFLDTLLYQVIIPDTHVIFKENRYVLYLLTYVFLTVFLFLFSYMEKIL